MSPELQIIVVFAVFILLLVIGMSVPFAIMVPSIVYLFLQGGFKGFNALGLVSWGSMNSFILTAIPLFILMAEIMQGSGLTTRVYQGLVRLVAKIPGGLLQTNIVGCAIFSTISGSSITTAASIGSVALPELQRLNYDPRLSAGSLAAGGTLGILIPPSLAMIIYSSFTETSVAKLFMAGVVPGALLTAMFMVYIAVIAVVRPDVAPKAGTAVAAQPILRALGAVLPFLILILFVLGSIYGGLATPTEAAALGCMAVLAICKAFGSMSLRIFWQALHQTVLVIGNIMFIVLAAYVFSYAISYAGVGDNITAWVLSLNLSRTEFFVAMFLLYTVLGCLIESVGMIVITVPLLFPILPQFGIDPIWFGIVLVVFVELGQISPPIGINLYVVQAMWNGKLSDVVMGTIPFHILMIVLLVMLVAWPEIALWLPSRMLN
jgi:tripartite ATP-independent transporter DctM subunit